MKLPTLNEIPTSRQWTDVFYGYNHNLRIAEGEFYDMTNMTGDKFPVLSPRDKRGIYMSGLKNARGLIDKDALCYVSGSDFYINKTNFEGRGLGLTVEYDEDGKPRPKQLVSMGAYVIIMPDKKYFNTENFNDYGSIEATYEATGTVTFQLALLNTEAEYEQGAEAPTDTKKVWLDTSNATEHQLKVYSEADEKWVAVSTVYVKIGASGIGSNFEIGDAVTISGIMVDAVRDIDDQTLIIHKKASDYIIVAGKIKRNSEQLISEGAVEIKRKMPDLDFICESGNRLWGCKYGIQSGKLVNEIYACKLGDFRNWNYFAGTAADSYAVSVGTDGVFTGAATHLGYPIFFKENYMHKVYGNYPANYQVQTTSCRGVQRGCHHSIATVNEVLYYKARSGIMAYDGSLPQEISAALGDEMYDDARAGWLGNKYYVCMRDSKKCYHVFVYDTKKGVWHREDASEIVCFCNARGDLYYIDRGTNQIKAIRGHDCGMMEEAPVAWEAVTGIIGTDSPDKKYVSRLDVRMKITPGAVVSFFAEYDSSGEWEHLFNMTGIDLKSFPVPVRPKRCDHMRLKIQGVGDAKIFSICKTIEEGSDV